MNRALIAGIVDYGWLGQSLPGCKADRESWSAYLGAKLSLGSSQVRVLADSGASRDAILEGVDWLLTDIGPNDDRVFAYAGHGARLTRAGVLQETLVAHPGAAQQPYDQFMIYDADLAARINAATIPASARITLIFDSCHSGGMDRDLLLDPDPQEWLVDLTRCLQLPEDLKASQAPAARAFTQTARALETNLAQAHRLLVAAAKPEQSAWDSRMADNKRHGVFTYYCVQALERSPDASVATIVEAARVEIMKTFPQWPQLLGDPSRFNQPLFPA
jgi:hypothetical protein